MSNEQQKILADIRRHLAVLHQRWARDEGKDGHHKSNEGYVGVFLSYPNWFEASDYEHEQPVVTFEVYSYLFGPHRLHEFESLEKAWEEVQTWRYPYV